MSDSKAPAAGPISRVTPAAVRVAIERGAS